MSQTGWIICKLVIHAKYVFLFYRYGNGAAIFTTSGAAARKFQTEIEAGQVSTYIIQYNIAAYALRTRLGLG